MISGTKEWAKKNVNCVTGCSHDCRYCYARANAKRFGKRTDETWPTEEIRQHDVERKIGKVKGTPDGGTDIMFPTTHDITPTTLDACVTMLGHILESGNTVLITSKPHLDCIMKICTDFARHNIGGTNQIMFRFSIGSKDNTILRYWDRSAPLFNERFESLILAWTAGFRTSISVEPCLDTANVVEMFHLLKIFVTNSIWIGKMNRVRDRVTISDETDERMVSAIEAGQTDDKVREVYEALKNEPLVRWKESYRLVLGLPLADEAGTDQ